jgi:hypothetical protein
MPQLDQAARVDAVFVTPLSKAKLLSVVDARG